MAAQHKEDAAYVRLAQTCEIPQLAALLTRAFARDPAMNWWGAVKELVPTHTSVLPSAVRSMKRLRHFQQFLIKGTFLTGGVVTVVVKPDDVPPYCVKHRSEKIVAVAAWLRPGQTWDLSILDLIRAGLLKNLIWGWGWPGFTRVTKIFTPHVEATLDQAFGSRGLDRLDSWHLLEIATDPDEGGKGYCGMLMREGFSRASPKPVHLEATTPASRDIYLHYGFEINEETRFGIGEVNEAGVRAAQGEEADGYPEWIMTKVRKRHRAVI